MSPLWTTPQTSLKMTLYPLARSANPRTRRVTRLMVLLEAVQAKGGAVVTSAAGRPA
jgi:hypothetical protein